MGKKRIVTKQESESLTDNQTDKVKISKKSRKKQILKGKAYIISSYNNTLISFTDSKGEVFVWSSAGLIGFKGTRKSTPYAATLVAKDAAEKAKQFGLREIIIIVKGIGPGRDAAVRGLAASGLIIQSIIDDTPIPHNGVRPPKPRRV